MAKLTKAQKHTLSRAYQAISRAETYLMSPNLAIARRCDYASTTLHYTRSDGAILYEVQKEYGSDLTGIFEAKRLLNTLLA